MKNNMLFIACLSIINHSASWAMDIAKGEQIFEKAQRVFSIVLSCKTALVNADTATACHLLDMHKDDEDMRTRIEKIFALGALERNEKDFLQAIKPHLHPDATGSGVNSLLGQAYKQKTPVLARAIVDNKLCTFLRKKNAQGADKETQHPFIELGGESCKAWICIKFHQRQDGEYEYDMEDSIIPVDEMNQWEIAPDDFAEKS